MKPYLSIQNRGYYYLFFKNTITNNVNRVNTQTKILDEAEIFKINFIKNYLEKSEPESNNNMKKLMLSEFINKLFEYLKHNVIKSTLSLYITAFTDFQIIVGDKLINEISVIDVEKYKYKISERIKKITVNKNLKCISAAFNVAINKFELLEKNPVDKVEYYRIEKKRIKYLEKAEIEKIMSVIDEEVYKKIILFALYSGARLNEILTLQWKDIDIKNKTIHLRSKEELGYTTKNHKFRLLSLTEQLKNILSEYSTRNDEGFIFSNKKNLRFSKDYISRKFKSYCIKVGMPEYKFHYLRHTFATTAIKSGISIYHLKEILGHSSIEVTAKNYLHSTITDIQESMSKLTYGLKIDRKKYI
ncbi:hypothetical protein BH10BAC5_BH10BAC5_25860 [soil metagenome]